MSQQRLLAGIHDDPTDDVVRLVYADWLEEFGDESARARAEFIRLQIRRARSVENAETERRREEELLRRWGHGWDTELRALVASCTYRRGFIEEIAGHRASEEEVAPTLRDFVNLAPRVWGLAPVQSLNCWDSGAAFRRVLSCAQFANVISLRCSTEFDDPEDVLAVAASPQLRGLVDLSIRTSTAEAEAAVPALLTASWPALRAFDYSCEYALASAASALAGSRLVGQLTTLGLSCEAGCGATGQVLAGCSALAHLTNLTLGIGDAGTAALLRSPHLHSLRSLDLTHGKVGVPTVTALAEAPWLDSLVSLDLYFNTLGAEGCRALASVQPAQLTNLVIGHTGLDTEALAALADGMRWPRLTALHMTWNGLTGEAVAPLTRSAVLAPLTRLELHSNRIDPAGARALADAPYLSGLRSLGLASNQIGPAGLAALAESTKLPRLDVLEVGNNEIDDDGIRFLASSPLLAQLRQLAIGMNHFSAAALRVLLEALADTGLVSLNLQGCHWGDEGAEVLATARPLPGLRYLDIGYNDITDVGARHLLNCPWLAQVPIVDWRGNKIEGEVELAAMRERWPGFPDFVCL